VHRCCWSQLSSDVYDDTIRLWFRPAHDLKSCWPHAEIDSEPRTIQYKKKNKTWERERNIKMKKPLRPFFLFPLWAHWKQRRKAPSALGWLWNALALPCWHSSKAIFLPVCCCSFSRRWHSSRDFPWAPLYVCVPKQRRKWKEKKLFSWTHSCVL